LKLGFKIQGVAEQNKGAEPAVGAEAEVGTGDVVLAAFERQEVELARLKNAVKVSDSGKTLPKGLLLEASGEVGSSRILYCSWHDAARYCLIDADGDRIFEKVTTTLGGRPLPRISGPYSLEYRAADDGLAWRKEIVYQGASGGVLRFTFRVYGGDWSNPTESRDVSYDLAPDGQSEVVYQGAKLKVLSADSNRVRYRVEAGFRTER
jgi:hypothetical protein